MVALFPEFDPSRHVVDLQIRCLSGCGEVINSVVLTDHARDGRNITPGCRGPRFTIFVSEQLWRSGISRISYRHDGNYVIFDRDMKLVAEGREDPAGLQEIDENAPQRFFTTTVTGTSSAPSENLSDYERHVQLIREAQMQRWYEERARNRSRNQRAPRPMTDADREREQIWREYINSMPPSAARPQEELTLTYNDLVRAMNSVEALASSPKPAKPPEPRRRRAVIRRALEKK